jgi:hypothetical protein
MKKIEFSAGAVFWFALVLAFFGFAFLNVVHAADLPGSNFALAPVSKVTLDQNEKLALIYAPEKLDSKLTQKSFDSLAQLITIQKTAYIGDVDFSVQICGAGGCYTPTKAFILKSGDEVRVRPSRITFASSKEGNFSYSVWENLFFDGVKIEGATWWNASFGYCTPLRVTTGTSAASPNSALNISVPFQAGMNATLKDLRIISANCSDSGAPVTYWQYFNSSGAYALLYLNTTGILANTVYNYSIYFGNQNIESASDLDALVYDTNGTANSTVAQYGEAWSSKDYSGTYDANNGNDGVSVSGYANSWMCPDGCAYPVIWGVKLAHNFTFVKSGLQQTNNYHVTAYRGQSSFDNATYSDGWSITGVPDTNYVFFNSTVSPSYLPQTGSYFIFNISSGSSTGAGAGEFYLFGFNYTNGVSYSLGGTSSLDLVAPIIDACNPANGSEIETGITTFSINASDDVALDALNHTDTFTGTTAYNFTPFNGSVWSVSVDLYSPGTYYWWASANDTSGNSANTENCSLIVSYPVTTTSIEEENETTTTTCCQQTAPVTLNIPGFGWFILFFIIAVSFIVLGGLSKS